MKHKTRGAALATAALVTLIALFGMTGCPNNAGGGGTPQASLVSGGASLILSADKLTIKVTVKTADSSSVTVEGCTETTLTSDSETELHAKGTTVILKGRIIKLVCSDNRLTALNVQGLNALEVLLCGSNRLTELNVQGLSALKSLGCQNNRLAELNVQGLNALKLLDCFSNQLTDLKVHNLSALESLSCHSNQLAELNVQGLSNLKKLGCQGNKLTELDAQGLNKLERLDCFSNRLTDLKVHNLSALESLSCQGNQLTSLNVSGCTALKTLNRSSNKIAGKFAVPAFFNSLPDRLPADDARCYLYTEKAGVPEGNLTNFTGSGVAGAFQNAKNRNWKMYKYDANGNPVEI
jgi:internalin-related protein